MEHIKSLSFASAPNYHLLTTLLKKALVSVGGVEGEPFDWQKKRNDLENIVFKVPKVMVGSKSISTDRDVKRSSIKDEGEEDSKKRRSCSARVKEAKEKKINNNGLSSLYPATVSPERGKQMVRMNCSPSPPVEKNDSPNYVSKTSSSFNLMFSPDNTKNYYSPGLHSHSHSGSGTWSGNTLQTNSIPLGTFSVGFGELASFLKQQQVSGLCFFPFFFFFFVNEYNLFII
jgi:hypothetical protein